MRLHWKNCRISNEDLQRRRHSLPYPNVATSDAVLYLAGTTLGQGIFPMASLPFSAVINKALLKPLSIFSNLDIGEEIEGKDETSVHIASRSNLT